jgi:uncharacterized membrane protein YdbT with pleckstrin-like domain
MSYIDETLSDGEQVVARFRLHWVAKLWLALWVVLVIPTFGLALFLVIYEYLRLRCIEQAVTNKRVVYKQGIISRRSEEMKLGSIETVEIRQSIAGRLLDYADIRVTGKGISDVVFRTLADPLEAKKQIESVSHPAATSAG